MELNSFYSREEFLNIFNIINLKSLGVTSNISNKDPTVRIYLITLHHVVFLGLPHLLADLTPPLGQLEVDKDVVWAEVVVSRVCHTDLPDQGSPGHRGQHHEGG